ncbi:MAG TPA: dTDP-4-dehydrorhamnose 3,5-epimerase [Bacteroidales bacterium]|nr:dTDP-4-dehydrorhamnose 3,5-epimerase [Bacteroidales bacterium]
MELIPTAIPDIKIFKPDVFGDDRGYFFESFHIDKFAAYGITDPFVQDNESKSQKNVLRGLHYQLEPSAQGKLVRVIHGAVLDVAVDIRQNSPTFGKWVTMKLTAENKWICWIPKGFAHGFVTLEDDTIFTYKCTGLYNKASEASIRWNDPELGIEWGVTQPLLSDKDKVAPLLKDAILF